MGNWKDRISQVVMGLLMGFLMNQSQATADDAISLGTVRVQAGTEARETGRLASSQVTIIPVAEARHEGKGLPEVLSDTAGVQIKHFGGLDDFSLVSIRGTSPTHTRLYLDGIPLPQTANGIVNLSNLPLSQIERIEVYKGAPPIDLSDSPIGGAVNLTTKKIPRTRSLGGEVGYGSFGTLHSSMNYGQFFNRSGFQLSAGYRRTDGDFSFLDDHGTPFNPNDDAVTKRQNNDSQDVSLTGQVETKREWGTLDFLSDFFLRHQGVPGLGNFQSTSARLDTWRHLVHARYRRLLWDEKGKTESGLFYSLEQDAFKDPNGEIGLASQRNKNSSLNVGGMELLSYAVGRHLLSTNGKVVWDFFIPKDEQTHADLQDHHRTAFQWGLQDEMTFSGERLSVVPSFRIEEDFEQARIGQDQFHYAPGLRARYAPWNFLYLKFGVSRGYRIPTFFELFGDRGTTSGNPDLLPETSFNIDGTVGFTLCEQGGIDEWMFEVTPFWIRADQLIIFEQNSQRTVVARNASSAEITGVELVNFFKLWHHAQLTANYTYQRAMDTSDIPFLNGNLLPSRPVHEIYMRPEFDWGPTKIFYEASLTGDNFLDRANFNKVGLRTVHNVGFSITPFRQTTVTFEAKNLSNNQIVDAIGFPLPGRSYFASINIDFNQAQSAVEGEAPSGFASGGGDASPPKKEEKHETIHHETIH